MVGTSFGADREELIAWLNEEALWQELSPTELAFLSSAEPTEKEMIEATWLSERLVVLLWSLFKVELPGPNKETDTALFLDLVPPFSNDSASEFIATAVRRKDEELLEMAEELRRFHWQARDSENDPGPMPKEIDIEIIQERHHAINWINGYEGLPWDEVTTDT